MNQQGHCLSRKNLYMLPTRHGLIFAIILFAMLLLAVNYNNSLAYMMTFTLFATVLVSMLYTHRNLEGICLSYGKCSPVFAGSQLNYTLVLSNEEKRDRFDIGIEIKGEQSRRRDFSEYQTLYIDCSTVVSKRGWHNLPAVQVNTRFPLGLLFSWCRPLELKKKCLVYPEPGPWQDFPARYADAGINQVQSKLSSDDYSGLRQYRDGDSLRLIDWKSYARGKGLYSKEFHGGESPIMIFEWSDTQGGREQRISQLTRWVIEAGRQGIKFGLVVPANRVAPGNDEKHINECLKILALL